MFYDNYQRMCKKKNLSASGCAMKIGLARSTAASWKRQGTIPKQEILEQLAEVLECNVADFFVENNDNSVTIQNSNNCNNTYKKAEDEHELLQIYRSLPSRKDRLKFLLECYEIAEKISDSND